MALAVITRSNLATQPRENVVYIFENNIVGTVKGLIAHRKWIYSTVPNTQANNFSGYPLVVIPYPSLNVDDKTMKNVKMMKGIFNCILYSDFKEDSSADGLVMNSVVTQFNLAANQDTLQQNGIKSVDIDFDESDKFLLQGDQVLQRLFRINFDVDINVESG